MKSFQKEILLKPHPRGYHLITKQILEQVPEIKEINIGWIQLFIKHTSASLTINENADPDVKKDILYGLSKTFTKEKAFQHYEGNSHAHIKSSVVGVSKIIIVEKNKMVLGTWQGIYFMEFDGPRTRSLVVRISGVK